MGGGGCFFPPAFPSPGSRRPGSTGGRRGGGFPREPRGRKARRFWCRPPPPAPRPFPSPPRCNAPLHIPPPPPTVDRVGTATLPGGARSRSQVGADSGGGLAEMTSLFGILGLSCVLCVALVPLVRAAARRCGLVDHPDGRRKMHARAVPLAG